MKLCRRFSGPIVCACLVLGLAVWCGAKVTGQEMDWIPTVETHAWSRFGLRSWKEVRVRAFSFDEKGEVERSSTTVARSRVTKLGNRSFSLCVSSTVEVAGREFPSEPQTITRDLTPSVQSSQVTGNETITIDGQDFPTQIIQFVTTNGTVKETNTLNYCPDTYPPMLRRVSTSVDTLNPDVTSEMTTTVTEMNKMTDILGELKCTWSVTTVIKQRDHTITIREVNCQDVPGELVSQVTEERDANGVLVSRKELELVGYGVGRSFRFFRRHR